jgi:hypothetical protein
LRHSGKARIVIRLARLDGGGGIDAFTRQLHDECDKENRDADRQKDTKDAHLVNVLHDTLLSTRCDFGEHC